MDQEINTFKKVILAFENTCC